MKPQYVAAQLEISPSTVRAWSIEYGAFLSPTGAPGTGGHRDFTDRDLSVLNHIKSLKNSGLTTPMIHQALKALQADDWRNLPEFNTTIDARMTVAAIPTKAAEMALDAERRSLMREIASLQERIAEIKQEAQERITSLETDNKTKADEIRNLSSRLAKAETLLGLFNAGKLKPGDVPSARNQTKTSDET